MKEILTKTNAVSTLLGGRKTSKVTKLNQKQTTDEMTHYMKEGLINKQNAVDGLLVPEIRRSQIRKETLLGSRPS